jgi:N-acetylneuraminate synthase
MPPFPWHFGGQRYHNLFMDADDIVKFCSDNNTRICLDISHSKLLCNFKHESFKEFLEKVSQYAAHIHMVDASGVDGEGLQINEGDIDFSLVSSIFKSACPNASFIPEIWQGHKNDCKGFWVALERLEKHF